MIRENSTTPDSRVKPGACRIYYNGSYVSRFERCANKGGAPFAIFIFSIYFANKLG